jgi:hypothetical protein
MAARLAAPSLLQRLGFELIDNGVIRRSFVLRYCRIRSA